MTGEEKRQEIINTRQQIIEVRKSIQVYTNQYDCIRYHYGSQYIEDRLELKRQIEKKSEEASFLTLKLSVLLDPNINLSDIEVEYLDTLSRLQKLQVILKNSDGKNR